MRFINEQTKTSIRKMYGITGVILWITSHVLYYTTEIELPMPYQVLLGSVIGFYFTKEMMQKLKISTDEKK